MNGSFILKTMGVLGGAACGLLACGGRERDERAFCLSRDSNRPTHDENELWRETGVCLDAYEDQCFDPERMLEGVLTCDSLYDQNSVRYCFAITLNPAGFNKERNIRQRMRIVQSAISNEICDLRVSRSFRDEKKEQDCDQELRTDHGMIVGVSELCGIPIETLGNE
jgi:hypothetical protein